MLFFKRRSARLHSPHESSRFRVEPLESRLLLSAVPGVAGALEAAAATTLTIRFDYQYDTQNFFGPAEKAALESAAAKILTRLTDTLDAITPGGDNHWTATFNDPSNESNPIAIQDLSIAENEIVIFAGGQDLPGDTLGKGGPGGFGISGTPEWVTAVKTRGEPGAADDQNPPTDIGLWGGAITFDNLTEWHFGETTEGLAAGESDFMSVALHELAHTFGFGGADSWNALIDFDNFVFTGAASLAEYDLAGPGVLGVPLNDPAHWLEGTEDEHHEAAMDPSIGPGERKNLTLLDFAGLDDIGWEVIGPILQPVALFTDISGIDIEMNAGFQESLINLYDTQAAGLGLPDVTVVGQATGPVRGSLVMDAIGGLLRFAKTGGPFAPDTYTVTLRSAADGFKDRDGALLDGDGDGIPGGNWVMNFVSDPVPAQVITLADFARGPGQPVDVPATATNLPIRLLDGAGVTKVEVTFAYDPELLSLVAFGIPVELPFGTQLSLQGTNDWTRLTLTLGEALSAGPANLIDVIADIPVTAPYGATGFLLLEDVTINDVDVGEADSAVFVVGYFGDTTGNGNLTASDAARILRVTTLLDSGFVGTGGAYRFADPALIADITANGILSSTDATRVLQEAVNIDVPEIPPIPPSPGSASPASTVSLTGTFAPTLLAVSGPPPELPSLAPKRPDSPLQSNIRSERRLWEWVVVAED
jgi:hypothetical protein